MRMLPSVGWAKRLDKQLTKPNLVEALEPTEWGWITTVRNATGWPLISLSKRLGVSKQAVSLLQAHERSGTISLAKLREVANALDCDLVYGFVPRESFADAAERLQELQDRARRAKRRLPAPE